MKRDIFLDVLRGLMLVIIAINHIHGPLNKITWEPFGVVSAAEGFIFLSGLVYGLVNTRKLNQSDFSVIKEKAFNRAIVIYFYHIVSFLLVLLIFLIVYYQHQIAESHELALLIEKPGYGFLLFLTFLFQPDLLDILPIYFIFILFSPFILKSFFQNKASTVFAISIIIYLLSQISWLQLIGFVPQDYNINPGGFNLFSWQLLFIAGIYIGYNRANGHIVLPRNKKVFVIFVILLAVFFLFRHSSIEIFWKLSNRTDLKILRLLNFFILAYCIDYLNYHTNIFKWRIFQLKELAFLGRHSLQVFSFHIILIYILNLTLNVFQLQDDFYTTALIQLFIVIPLFIPAYLHEFLVTRFQLIRRLGL